MVVVRPNYKGIPPDRDIIFLASGGRDSTAMVLEAYQLGLKGTLLFGYTKFNDRGRKTIERLAKYTGFHLHIAEYAGEEKPIKVLNESFRNIPKTKERIIKTGRFQRNYFYCCKKLKHGPMDDYIDTLYSIPIIQVMGIKKTDGNIHRRLRLGQLRKRKDSHRLKADGSLWWYPLRDCTDNDISMILDEHGFNDIPHSGCSLCPILCLYEGSKKKDPKAYNNSMKKAIRMGVITDDQLSLEVFCK